jgi:hypothetical protein
MYVAKHLGKARYSFFRAEFNQRLTITLQLERELRHALQHDEFVHDAELIALEMPV